MEQRAARRPVGGRAFCLKAIELCQAIGYSPGEAGTWDTLGVVLQRLGTHDEAVPCFLRAVTLDREMGNRYDLAMVLAHLGETYAATGDPRGAREAWDESLAILRVLHHPAAGQVRGNGLRSRRGSWRAPRPLAELRGAGAA